MADKDLFEVLSASIDKQSNQVRIDIEARIPLVLFKGKFNSSKTNSMLLSLTKDWLGEKYRAAEATYSNDYTAANNANFELKTLMNTKKSADNEVRNTQTNRDRTRESLYSIVASAKQNVSIAKAAFNAAKNALNSDEYYIAFANEKNKQPVPQSVDVDKITFNNLCDLKAVKIANNRTNTTSAKPNTADKDDAIKIVEKMRTAFNEKLANFSQKKTAFNDAKTKTNIKTETSAAQKKLDNHSKNLDRAQAKLTAVTTKLLDAEKRNAEAQKTLTESRNALNNAYASCTAIKSVKPNIVVINSIDLRKVSDHLTTALENLSQMFILDALKNTTFKLDNGDCLTFDQACSMQENIQNTPTQSNATPTFISDAAQSKQLLELSVNLARIKNTAKSAKSAKSAEAVKSTKSLKQSQNEKQNTHKKASFWSALYYRFLVYIFHPFTCRKIIEAHKIQQTVALASGAQLDNVTRQGNGNGTLTNNLCSPTLVTHNDLTDKNSEPLVADALTQPVPKNDASAVAANQ